MLNNQLKQELAWTPFYFLLRREVGRFLKVAVQTVVAPIINTCLYLLIFGVSLGGAIEIYGAETYLGFLIPGLIMMACLNNAFANTSSSVVGSKFSGELEDYKASPLSHQQIIWALGLGGTIRGLIVGTITFVVGEVFYFSQYGIWLEVHDPFLLCFLSLVGGLAFSMMGMSVALWARTFDQLSAIGSFVLLPLIYLGGVFYSISSLPLFWQGISRLNPLLYLINGLRFAILGQSDVEPLTSVAVSILMLIGFYIIGRWSLYKGSFQRW